MLLAHEQEGFYKVTTAAGLVKCHSWHAQLEIVVNDN